MNKVTVTVTNIATFEDCCEWLAKTRGKEARDMFEKEIEEKLNDVIDYDSRFD
jgi:hypothetical protein